MARNIGALKEQLGLAPKTKRNTVPLRKIRKVSTERMNYYYKLQEGLLSEMNEYDWIMYFNDAFFRANKFLPKYSEDRVGKSKRLAVMKRVVNNFEPKDIKLMIDFLFEAEHDLKPKSQINIFILSAGFLDAVALGAQAWEVGEYQTKAQMYKAQYSKNTNANTNREWDTAKHKEKPTEEFSL